MKRGHRRSGIDPVSWQCGSSVHPHGVPTRFLTLNEYFDDYGRLIQILGNDATRLAARPTMGPQIMVDYPATSATEERVTAGATEVWEIYNTTADVHPMHFHLVNVQVINRQLFAAVAD